MTDYLRAKGKRASNPPKAASAVVEPPKAVSKGAAKRTEFAAEKLGPTLQQLEGVTPTMTFFPVYKMIQS